MFRSRFLWRLYAGYVALILLAATIVGSLIARQITAYSLQEIERSLQARAVLLRDLATEPLRGSTDAALQQRVRALGSEIGTRFTIIRADGSVIADSQEDPSRMDNHANRPEILEARSRTQATATRLSTTVGAKMMYLALPVRQNGRLLGFVRAALPLSDVDEQIAHLRRIVALGAAISAFVALLLGFFVARGIARPLTSMTSIAESMARGDYDQTLPSGRSDEIGTLAKAFNRMAKSSRDRMETINTDRNKLLTILAGIVEGVVAVDRDERIVHMNAAAGKILHTSPESSLGRPIREISGIREVCDTLDRALREQTEVKGETRLLGRPRDLVIGMHASPLRNGEGELVGAVVVLHDLSELSRLESVRRDFVASVSHELKTPITAIRGLVETLIDDEEMPHEKRERFLGKIRDQSVRLGVIVTDLLALSHLESEGSALERKPLDLREIVSGTVQRLLPVYEERGIVVETELPDEPVTVLGDDEVLLQATGNLLDNALKYTPPGGRVWVRARSEGSHAILEVQDTGIGIEPTDQLRIFERFYRVDKARSRELGGTGLGLSIVKHTALAHDGEVSVDSTPGAGSTFRIVLPLAAQYS